MSNLTVIVEHYLQMKLLHVWMFMQVQSET